MKVKYAIAAVAAMAVIGVCQDAMRSVWDGVFTDEQAKRGQGSYNAECASCHGDQLTGGEMAPPLVGGEFMSNWGGLSVGDLFDRVRTTMPAGKPGKLSREVDADIIAYILAFNKFPAGDKDLSHQSEVLKQIRLDAEKPKK